VFTYIVKAIHDILQFIVIHRLDRRIRKLKNKINSPIIHPSRFSLRSNDGEAGCYRERKSGNDIL
jgi:hypothetical protein